MGVIVRIIFSFTPDEAMSVGLAKACVRRNKSILFIEKSSALKKAPDRRKAKPIGKIKKNIAKSTPNTTTTAGPSANL